MITKRDLCARGEELSYDVVKKRINYYITIFFLKKEFSDIEEFILNNIIEKCRKENTPDDYIFDFELNKSEANIPEQYYKDNYTQYIDMKYSDQKKEFINKLNILEKYNPNAFQTIHFDFLDDKYINNIPKEIYLTLTCFPKQQFEIINMNDYTFTIFINIIKQLQKSFSIRDIEINLVKIFDFCDSIYDQNIELNNINYEMLTHFLFNDFSFVYSNDIPTKEFNLYEYYKKNTIEQINSGKKDEMISAILQLKYGITLQDAIEIFKNADKIIGNENSMLSILYKFVIEISNFSEEELVIVYNSILDTTPINKFLIRKKMQEQVCKLYNESLFKMENNGNNIYDAPDEFNMIIHVTSAFSISEYSNYEESWNRNEPASLWFSTSYISNNMICTAPIRKESVCYGFNSMEESSLLFYSDRDLMSETTALEQNWFAQESENILPRDLINRTNKNFLNDGNQVYYNEMDFSRFQNGEKKQPDYIVLFKNNGEFVNEEVSKTAQKEFGNLPIVIVDIDKNLKKQKEKIERLYVEFLNTKDYSIIEEIKYIAENSAKTCYAWNKLDNYFLSESCISLLEFIRNELYLQNLCQVPINSGFKL